MREFVSAADKVVAVVSHVVLELAESVKHFISASTVLCIRWNTPETWRRASLARASVAGCLALDGPEVGGGPDTAPDKRPGRSVRGTCTQLLVCGLVSLSYLYRDVLSYMHYG